MEFICVRVGFIFILIVFVLVDFKFLGGVWGIGGFCGIFLLFVLCWYIVIIWVVIFDFL